MTAFFYIYIGEFQKVHWTHLVILLYFTLLPISHLSYLSILVLYNYLTTLQLQTLTLLQEMQI